MNTNVRVINNFSGEHAFLSNFSPSYHFISVTDSLFTHVLYFTTLEHAYQAYKCKNNRDIFKILEAKTPGPAKKIGRNVELIENWDIMRISIMKMLLKDKFSNPGLMKKLKETGDALLIEGNTWKDTFWGVCNGVGENQLGKLLMLIRDK